MNRRSCWTIVPVFLAVYAACMGLSSGATFVVSNAADTGAGSLRQAITSANSLPGPDAITFNLPGSGLQTISPASALPSIMDAVIIDATTQPGFAGKPRVNINGSRAGLTYGLILAANNCSLRGIAIGNCPGAGVLVTGVSNVISGCFLGTDAEGTVARPNGIGILVNPSATRTLVGGRTVAERNVLSGNRDLGVCLLYSEANTVQGNFIGMDSSGSAALPNGNDGITVDHSSHCVIGGSSAGEGNLISGNTRSGIRALGPPGSGNVIQGNIIGMDTTGNFAVGNHGAGIAVLNSAENTIGGVEPGAGNLISGNLDNGILIQDSGATGNLIQGNRIGLGIQGTNSAPNYLNGIAVSQASETTVGGIAAGAGNVISGNRLYGIDLNGSNDVVQGNLIGTDATGVYAVANGLDPVSGGGVVIRGSNERVGGDSANGRNLIAGNHHDGVLIDGANNCLVQANWIGLNGLGHPLSNEGNGIVVNGGRTNMIGGSRPGTGNVCSGNALAGILLSTGAVANVLLGNLVGTDAAGVGPAGNGGAGVEAAGALNNQIGGRAAGEANRIAFNRSNGVLVRGDTTAGITISGNSVFGNSGHAINLQPAGEKENRITPNDPFDEDGGPNHLQNAPMITNTTYVSGMTVISGILGSREENNYRIEVFRNDPYSGYVFGEGQIYGGDIGVLSDSSGRAQFQISLAGDFSNQLFCATATDLATGDTSEFSPALPVLKGVLRIVEARRLGENELISFTTETNRQYRLEWTEILPAPFWNPVSGASNVTGTGEVVVVSDPLINQPSERFYRIVAMP